MSEAEVTQAFEEVIFEDLVYNGNCYGLGSKLEIPVWSRNCFYYFPMNAEIRQNKTHLPIISVQVPVGVSDKMLKLRCGALRIAGMYNIINLRSTKVVLVKDEDLNWKSKFDMSALKNFVYNDEDQSDAINFLFFCAGNYWCTGDSAIGENTKGVLSEWVNTLVGNNVKESNDFKDICRETILYVDMTKVLVKLGHALPKYARLSKKFIEAQVPNEFARRVSSYAAGNAKLKLCLSIIEKLRSDIVWYFYPKRQALKLLFEARDKYVQDPFSYHINFSKLTGLEAPPSITSLSESNCGRMSTIAFLLIPENPISKSASVAVNGTFVGRKYDDFTENFYNIAKALKAQSKIHAEEKVKIDELDFLVPSKDPVESMKDMEDMITAADEDFKRKHGTNLESLRLICENPDEEIKTLSESAININDEPMVNKKVNDALTINVNVAGSSDGASLNFLTPTGSQNINPSNNASSSSVILPVEEGNVQGQSVENSDQFDLSRLSPEDKEQIRRSLTLNDGNDVITLQKTKRTNVRKNA